MNAVPGDSRNGTWRVDETAIEQMRVGRGVEAVPRREGVWTELQLNFVFVEAVDEMVAGAYGDGHHG